MKFITLFSALFLLLALSACHDARQKLWSYPSGYTHHKGTPNSPPGLDYREPPIKPKNNEDLTYNK